MWPGADAGSSVLLEWIHALVAGLAGAIYREHKPADLRSAGQPGKLSPQVRAGCSTSMTAARARTLAPTLRCYSLKPHATVGGAVCRIPCLGGGFVSNLMFS